MKGKKYPLNHPIHNKNPKKGHKSWNEGLTKSTNKKLLSIAKNISKALKQTWQNMSEDEKNRKTKHFAKSGKSFNGLEKKISYLLRKICPGEFKYNGAKSVSLRIENKIPDFINVKGKNKLIEVFSEYFKLKQNIKKYIQFKESIAAFGML